MNINKPCLFCDIYNLSKQKIIYETENIFVINDINPQASIHMLFISKKHIISINKINKSDLNIISDIFVSIKKIAIMKNINNYKIINNNGKKAGQMIDHLHFHFIANE